MRKQNEQKSKRTPDGRFASGKSGNPHGRPKGSRNKITLAAEELLEGQCERLTRKVIELALEGNMMALRLCLDRVLPPRRDRLVELDLPELRDPNDATEATRRILHAVAEGKLTVQEAEKLNDMVRSFSEGVLLLDFETRIVALESVKSAVEEATDGWYGKQT